MVAQSRLGKSPARPAGTAGGEHHPVRVRRTRPGAPLAGAGVGFESDPGVGYSLTAPVRPDT
jgi:hypothetical protein